MQNRIYLIHLILSLIYTIITFLNDIHTYSNTVVALIKNMMQLEETVKKKDTSDTKIHDVTLLISIFQRWNLKFSQYFKVSKILKKNLHARLFKLFFKNNCPKNFSHENNNWNIAR